MGLDMYLSAQLYTSKYSHEAAYETLAKIEPPGVIIPPQYIENFGSFRIEVPLMYWRKANHIHRWFVETVQDGQDECQTSSVDIEQLRELARLCSEVAAAGTEKDAKAKLPTTEGFFFGGTEYDKYYFEKCRDTMQALDRLLADYDAGKLEGWNILYHASW